MLKTLREKFDQVTGRLLGSTVLCPNGACSHVGPGLTTAGAGDFPVCAICRTPLPASQQHSLPPFPVAVLGGTGTGKTVWLLQSLAALCNETKHQEGPEARFALAEQYEKFSRSHGGLKMGRWPMTTSTNVPIALCVNVTTSGSKSQLYVYDLAGVECREAARLRRHLYLQHVRGVVFMIDPFALPQVREKYAAQLKHTRTNVRPSSTPAEDILSALLQTLHEVGGQDTRQLAVAAILSKTEAFDLGRQIDAAGASNTEQHACRQSLIAWGGGHTVRALEHHFASVAYFRCRVGTTGLQSPHRPLLWLMGMDPELG
ncbi:MAG: hypothetical protein HYZ50_20060 [Deltaproteobacteria bacterium]|nr:hypothetical protein [Deltaproteobacteria bacterium]